MSHQKTLILLTVILSINTRCETTIHHRKQRNWSGTGSIEGTWRLDTIYGYEHENEEYLIFQNNQTGHLKRNDDIQIFDWNEVNEINSLVTEPKCIQLDLEYGFNMKLSHVQYKSDTMRCTINMIKHEYIKE